MYRVDLGSAEGGKKKKKSNLYSQFIWFITCALEFIIKAYGFGNRVHEFAIHVLKPLVFREQGPSVNEKNYTVNIFFKLRIIIPHGAILENWFLETLSRLDHSK